MKANKLTELPPPPSLISALMAGFDAITRSMFLILFPVALDLLLWLGPHLNIGQLVDQYLEQMRALSSLGAAETAEFWQANQELWALFGENMNLMAVLRTYPVGIPSLMSSWLPTAIPGSGEPFMLYLSTTLSVLVVCIILAITGLVLGSLYYLGVAEAALSQQVNWLATLKSWPRVTVQVLLLALMFIAVFVAISVPASCLISALLLTGPTISRLAVLVIFAGLIWLIFPLLLSAHGIFVYGNNMLASVKKSLALTRMTYPTTALLFLTVIIISQGLDIVWRIPPEDSWFTLVGIFGHAFIATGLLSATFIYYRNADRWVQRVHAYWSQLSSPQPKT